MCLPGRSHRALDVSQHPVETRLLHLQVVLSRGWQKSALSKHCCLSISGGRARKAAC